MKMETKRLILRELTMEDFDALHEILSDPQTMQHYPAPFGKWKPVDGSDGIGSDMQSLALDCGP